MTEIETHEVPHFGKWRTKMAMMEGRYTIAQEIAEAAGLDDRWTLSFWDRIPCLCLDLPAGTTREEFGAEIQAATDALGLAPHTVGGVGTAARYSGAVVVSLTAEWDLIAGDEPGRTPYIKAMVRCGNTTGCNLHPDKPGPSPSVWAAGTDAPLHPECAAALESLVDQPVEVEPC